MKKLDDIKQRLKESAVAIARASELLEAKAAEVEADLKRLVRCGALANTPILGPVVSRETGPRIDMAIINQAALVPSRGFGLVAWDLDSFVEHKYNDVLEEHAADFFMPLAKCQPYARMLLLPHFENLLDRAVKSLNDKPRRRNG